MTTNLVFSLDKLNLNSIHRDFIVSIKNFSELKIKIKKTFSFGSSKFFNKAFDELIFKNSTSSSIINLDLLLKED